MEIIDNGALVYANNYCILERSLRRNTFSNRDITPPEIESVYALHSPGSSLAMEFFVFLAFLSSANTLIRLC